MATYNPSHIIPIVCEKRLQNKPSMGRNQWAFLKRFDGKRISDYIEAAKAETRQARSGTYQEGEWWLRELAWNLERGNVELVPGDTRKSSVTPVAKESTDLHGSTTTSDSGLYVVTLNNAEPVSANANDPRMATTSVMVNKDNCKFGKARSLSARRGNYISTFGEQNVNFLPIASVSLERLEQAERLVVDRLKQYRISGQSGRLTEWMKAVNSDEVAEVAYRTLAEHGVPFKMADMRCQSIQIKKAPEW
jgi:hypothetical protein